MRDRFLWLVVLAVAAWVPSGAVYAADVDGRTTVAGQVLVVFLGVFLSVLCVAMHYEALRVITLYLPKLGMRPRPRILLLILALLAVHQAEVWNFAWGYLAADYSRIMGSLVGADGNLLTYAYFSTITYTTLGYGEIFPEGPIRFIAAVEALTGFVLVTWSASFTFLEMQRFWRDK